MIRNANDEVTVQFLWPQHVLKGAVLVTAGPNDSL